MIFLTRRATFSASHYYWNPSWTITHGAIQTTNIYDMEATAVGIGSGKLLPADSYKKMVSTDLRGKTCFYAYRGIFCKKKQAFVLRILNGLQPP